MANLQSTSYYLRKCGGVTYIPITFLRRGKWRIVKIHFWTHYQRADIFAVKGASKQLSVSIINVYVSVIIPVILSKGNLKIVVCY